MIFPWYVVGIESMLGVDPRKVLLVNGKDTFPHVTSAIAAVHTVFNLANTLLFLPIVPICVRFLVWAVPSRGFKEKPRLTDLDVRMLETPALAIEQSHKEIQKMGDGCLRMLDWLRELRHQEEPDKALADRLRHREQVLDNMQDEVSEFMTNLLSGNIPHAVADEARRQLQLADEYESMSDYIANLEKFDRKLRRDGLRFSPEQRAELDQLNQLCREYLVSVNEAMAISNRLVQTKTEPMSKRIREAIKLLRRKHLDQLSQVSMSPIQTVAFMASLNAYSRVRDHIHEIAEEVSEQR